MENGKVSLMLAKLVLKVVLQLKMESVAVMLSHANQDINVGIINVNLIDLYAQITLLIAAWVALKLALAQLIQIAQMFSLHCIIPHFVD